MYREQVLLLPGFILEIMCSGKDRWKLSLRKGKKLLVEYSNASGYEFKSVEQLRYDFEKDVESALHKGR